MLAHPYNEDKNKKKIWSLKSKFNLAIKEAMKIEKYMEFIELSQMNELRYFNQFGQLTISGQYQFWLKINGAIKEFDRRLANWENFKEQELQ